MAVTLTLAMAACNDRGGNSDDASDGGSETAGDDSGTGDGDDDGGEEDTFQPAAGGMRKLLGYQYVNSIELMFGPEAAALASPPADLALHGYPSIGAAQLSPGLDLVELYETSALKVTAAAVANPTTLAAIVPCVETPSDACYTEIALKFGHIAWRRPLTDAEIASLVDIALQAKDWGEGEFMVGVQYELVRLLVSPHFIYVSELGVPDPNKDGRFTLTGAEQVTRMSLLLNGRIPLLDVLEQAEAGTYDDDDALEQLARTMLLAPEAKPAINQFFAQYLGLDQIGGKNTELFPLYTEALVSSMQEESWRLINRIVWDTNADFRSFLDSDSTFIDANLAELYGVPAPEAGDWAEVQLPVEHNRAGFLTHASFLARNSHNSGNSITRRGQYIQQRFLCFTVPPPPPEVTPELPHELPGDMTLRELLEQIHLSDPSCASCHEHLDKPAFPLENFDAIGAFRTTEFNGLPIDPVVEYSNWGLLEHSGDLAASVAMDPRLTDCVANNLLRFGRGGLEQPISEQPALAALYDEFEASNFRVQELLVQLVISPLFRQVGAPK